MVIFKVKMGWPVASLILNCDLLEFLCGHMPFLKSTGEDHLL